MDGPLKNLLVVDLTRVLVGPYCTMILSDLGARVIKIEAPEIGDDSRKFGPFVQDSIRPCARCGGSGREFTSKCKACAGDGKKNESQVLRFNVPPGAQDGTRLRIRGKGQPAPFGKGVPGDLFIELVVEEHPWFERNNTDLIMSLPVGYSDLVLGRTVTIEHIDGAPLDIKIPKNSNSGDTIEIKRRGLPSMRGKYRGDVIVLLKLFMPKKV